MPVHFSFLSKRTKSGQQGDSTTSGQQGAEEDSPDAPPDSPPDSPPVPVRPPVFNRTLTDPQKLKKHVQLALPSKVPALFQKSNSFTVAPPPEEPVDGGGGGGGDARGRLQSIFVTDDYRNVFRNMVTRAKKSKPLTNQERVRAMISFDSSSLYDSQISKEQFKALCLKEVALGLSEVEIERVWEKMDVNNDGYVNEEEFLIEAREWRLLRKLASIVMPEKSSFIVPNDYDFSKSTEENYKNPEPEDFIGDHVHIRKEIDKSYHGNCKLSVV
jgi:hypothetical protein